MLRLRGAIPAPSIRPHGMALN